MNILFIDTETNGKPRRYNASMADVDNWPRVTQLAWQIAQGTTGKVILDRTHIIKPNGWVIPKEQFFIEHNMTTERCQAEGIPLEEVIDTFLHHISDFQCDVIVSHNIEFDINVLGAEMIRQNKKPSRKLQQICTMKHGTDLCKLPGKFKDYKWPKLEELFRYLFNKDFDNAHDAGAGSGI